MRHAVNSHILQHKFPNSPEFIFSFLGTIATIAIPFYMIVEIGRHVTNFKATPLKIH
jgi:hypothetical protein